MSSSVHLRPIAIFDSGIGGLPYLAAARAALDKEAYIYLADRAGFPYGSKSSREVQDLVLPLISRLVEVYDPKALVIACNTASQAALEAAREENPGLPIVGTVPAVKTGSELSRGGVVGVLATAGTVADPYLDSLVARHAEGRAIIRESAQDLVAFIERRSATAGGAERRAAVAPHVRRLVDAGADVIVLGCTHFIHLRDEIAEAAGPGVEIVDSRAGVVKRLRQVLGDRGLLQADSQPPPRGLFLLTGDAPFEAEYFLFAEAFGLSGPEPISGSRVQWKE